MGGETVRKHQGLVGTGSPTSGGERCSPKGAVDGLQCLGKTKEPNGKNGPWKGSPGATVGEKWLEPRGGWHEGSLMRKVQAISPKVFRFPSLGG